MKSWKRAVSYLSAFALCVAAIGSALPSAAEGTKAAAVDYVKTFQVATPGGVLRILDMDGNLLEELEDGESVAFPYGAGFSSPKEVRIEAIAEPGYLVDSYVTSWVAAGEVYEVPASLHGIKEKDYKRGHYLASAEMDETFTVSFTDTTQESKMFRRASRNEARAADPENPAVGDSFTGSATVHYDGHPNKTYNGTGYISCTDGAFSGEDITLSNCASGHDFAAPQTGQTGVYTITITEIDADKGIVKCTVYWDNDMGTSGYQDLSGTYQYRYNPSGELYIQKGISGSLAGFVRTSEESLSLAATFGVYSDEACKNLVRQVKTDENGDMIKDGIELDAGTYYVKEIKAPKGFALNETVKKVKVGLGASKSVMIKDKPIRAKVVGVKIDADTGNTTPTAGLSLEGAIYGVFSNAACTKQVAEGVTDASGNIVFTNPYFLLGTYYIKELHAPEGYDLDTEIYKIEVDESIGFYKDSAIRLNDLSFTSKEPPSTGWAKIKKVSANPEITDGNRCYSLDQATFSVTNALTGEVLPERLITNAKGESQEIELPVGEYIVKEESAPKGYIRDLGEHRVTVRKNETTICAIENEPASDPVALLLKKIDAETGEEVPTGNGTFQGAQYTIRYYDGQYQSAGELAAVEPLRTWVLETNESGKINFSSAVKISGDDFYYNFIGVRVIPLGTITIQETKVPEGYKIDPTVYIRNFDAEVGTGELITSYQVAESPEPVIRGDLEGIKVAGGDMKRMANVPFKITSVTTGESHTVVTDENGKFSTSSSWNPHSRNTNRGETSEDGVWFGDLEALDDGTGALPYDTYRIEEQPCEANKDKVLLDPFDVTVSKDMVTVDLGTITNEYEPVPEISTTATDQETGSHYGYAGEATTIIDLVEYSNLIKGREYIIKGMLMDQETGKPLLSQGKEVTAEITFTAPATYGSVKLEFTFDSSALKGKKAVVFERLYYGEKEVVSHTDLEDEGQTVEFLAPELATQATDQETGEQTGFSGEKTTIKDQVVYTGLLPGKEYTIKGILMDRETGEPFLNHGKEVTAEKTFTAVAQEGRQELSYSFDSQGWKGKAVVVFETLYYGDREIASHTDLADESQTVQYVSPKLSTTASDQESGGHMGTAGSQTTVIDRVSYDSLLPGKEYTIKGILMEQETGKPFLDHGKEVTAETVIIAEKPEGNLEMAYSFNSQEWKGKAVVVFERLYYNGREIASHTDLADEGQTVKFWNESLHTSAKDQETGESFGFPSESSTIIDTVQYEGLAIGNTYTVKGILMNQETGEPFLDQGKAVTAEKTFTAEQGSGSIELEFTFDSSSLKGKQVVVFERLYYKDREVAAHADIEDKGQTVGYQDVKLGTSAAEKKSGKKQITTEKKTTVTDTVKYENLISGKEYTVKGTLMDKETKKELRVNGRKITAEKTFTAKEASGSVELEFTFDSRALEGKKIVVFEHLYYEGREIAVHADIHDTDQTVQFVEIETEKETEKKKEPVPETEPKDTGGISVINPPKTGDGTNIGIYLLLIAAAIAVFGVMEWRKKKKTESAAKPEE